MPRICRVLVVEDHDGVRTILGDALHHKGYRFTLAADGAEMRRALAAETFDIVLVDILMRGDEGFELAREAATHGAGIILVSGDQRLEEAMRRSGHRYIMKPFGLPSLFKLVQQVLRETKNKCRTRQRQSAASPVL